MLSLARRALFACMAASVLSASALAGDPSDPNLGANPDLIRLGNPVIRDALRGAARSDGPGMLRARSREICLAVVRLRDPNASLRAADLAFADAMADEVARNRTPAVRPSSLLRATQDPKVPPPPTPNPVVTGQIAEKFRAAVQLWNAFQELQRARVSDKPLTPPAKYSQLLTMLDSDEFRQVFSQAVGNNVAPTQADINAVKPILASLVGLDPAQLPPDQGPPTTTTVPTAPPETPTTMPTTPPITPDGSGADAGGDATVVTGPAAQKLRDFLKIASNELLDSVVNGKKLTREQRKQQLLLYIDSDGFLAEYKDLTGKAALSDADKKALGTMVEGLLDEPSTATASPANSSAGNGSAGNANASTGQVINEVANVASDVSQILGGPSLTQFTTLANDAYILLGRPTLGSFSLGGGRLCPLKTRRRVRYIRTY